jgi:hypothetical protein
MGEESSFMIIPLGFEEFEQLIEDPYSFKEHIKPAKYTVAFKYFNTNTNQCFVHHFHALAVERIDPIRNIGYIHRSNRLSPNDKEYLKNLRIEINNLLGE